MGKQPTLERSYRGKVHGNAVILYKAPHLLSPFSIDRCSLFRKLACNDHASLRSDSSRGYRRLIGHPTMDPPFFQAILPRKIFTNSSPLSLVAHAPPPPPFFFRFFSFSFSLCLSISLSLSLPPCLLLLAALDRSYVDEAARTKRDKRESETRKVSKSGAEEDSYTVARARPTRSLFRSTVRPLNLSTFLAFGLRG